MPTPTRIHPHLYEINAWLACRSCQAGRVITAGSVPDAEWSRVNLTQRGSDAHLRLGKSHIVAVIGTRSEPFDGFTRAA
jgi:hypothetical protein